MHRKNGTNLSDINEFLTGDEPVPELNVAGGGSQQHEHPMKPSQLAKRGQTATTYGAFDEPHHSRDTSAYSTASSEEGLDEQGQRQAPQQQKQKSTPTSEADLTFKPSTCPATSACDPICAMMNPSHCSKTVKVSAKQEKNLSMPLGDFLEKFCQVDALDHCMGDSLGPQDPSSAFLGNPPMPTADYSNATPVPDTAYVLGDNDLSHKRKSYAHPAACLAELSDPEAAKHHIAQFKTIAGVPPCTNEACPPPEILNQIRPANAPTVDQITGERSGIYDRLRREKAKDAMWIPGTDPNNRATYVTPFKAPSKQRIGMQQARFAQDKKTLARIAWSVDQNPSGPPPRMARSQHIAETGGIVQCSEDLGIDCKNGRLVLHPQKTRAMLPSEVGCLVDSQSDLDCLVERTLGWDNAKSRRGRRPGKVTTAKMLFNPARHLGAKQHDERLLEEGEAQMEGICITEPEGFAPAQIHVTGEHAPLIMQEAGATEWIHAQDAEGGRTDKCNCVDCKCDPCRCGQGSDLINDEVTTAGLLSRASSAGSRAINVMAELEAQFGVEEPAPIKQFQRKRDKPEHHKDSLFMKHLKWEADLLNNRIERGGCSNPNCTCGPACGCGENCSC